MAEQPAKARASSIFDPKLLSGVLSEKDAAKIIAQVDCDHGDFPTAVSKLDGKLPQNVLQTATLVYSLSGVFGDEPDLIAGVMEKVPAAKSLRDVALGLSLEDLTSLVRPTGSPAVSLAVSTPSTSSTEKEMTSQDLRLQDAHAVRTNLFKAQPTAVIHRMVIDNEINITTTGLRDGVVQFLQNQPDEFNIRKTSILVAMKHPNAFLNIPLQQQEDVSTKMKSLQRVTSLAAQPQDIATLHNGGIDSAFQVSSIPQKAFVAAFSPALGQKVALNVHQHAMSVRARNDQALVSLLQTVRGTGIAAIDGNNSLESRKQLANKKLNTKLLNPGPIIFPHKAPTPITTPTVIDLESMFGSLDYCECSDCNSVTSPAAYLVELFQFLRNNNLNWDTSKWPNSGQQGFANTILARLFARRPDLQYLELTCANTNTMLPYLDLANEVMESFVVHRISYEKDTNIPKQTIIEVYNVEDETSSELLSEPQHTNYIAYCILKDAVFPIRDAPYHQAIDEARIFLKYLGTSRYEVLSTFQPGFTPQTGPLAAQNEALKVQHQVTLDRSTTAEFWNMTPIDFIAITKEAYWSKDFWDIVESQTLSDSDYMKHIGRKDPWVYWGYKTEPAMESMVVADQSGLTFVKAQFLPRSGMIYTDLVDLIQTQFINPNQPSGRALQILESLTFSYQYLNIMIPPSAPGQNPKTRFAKAIDVVLNWQPWAIAQGVKNLPIPISVSKKELTCWFETWWDPVGQLIVLDSMQKPRLPFEGIVASLEFAPRQPQDLTLAQIGYLDRYGSITSGSNVIGSVGMDGTVVDQNQEPFFNSQSAKYIVVLDPSVGDLTGVTSLGPHQALAYLTNKSQLATMDSFGTEFTPMIIQYLPVTETCSIDTVQIIHLDGSPLSSDEWDRMQRFIRLYQKLGYTIDQTDQALIGLATPPTPVLTPPTPSGMDSVTTWPQIIDSSCCECGVSAGGCSCGGGQSQPDDGDICDCVGPGAPLDITPDFLEELIAVENLRTLGSIDLVQLLTLWTPISTKGNPSLYSTLFLVHSIYAIDPVFKADANGLYFTTPAKISDHVPVILAALRLTSAELTAVLSLANLADDLTLESISTIYRYCVLARILSVKVLVLTTILPLFETYLPSPFSDAKSCLQFVQLWNTFQAKGFTVAQLNYIVSGIDNPLKPVGPSFKTVLQTTKTIFDGLNAILVDNPDFAAGDIADATVELVTTKASLVFDQPTTAQIVGLLQGTSIYSTNAPSGLSIVIPDSLKAKFQYSNNTTATPPEASITVTGILTTDEVTSAKALSTNPLWSQAIDRVGKQAVHFFDATLFGIFPNEAEAKSVLLAGDIAPPPPPASPTDPLPVDNSTGAAKRLYFLQGFLPFVRKTLSDTLVLNTMSSAANLSTPEIAQALLTQAITIGSSSALVALESIQQAPAASAGSWSGYIIPSSDDSLVFVAGGFDQQPPPLTINGQSVPFPNQQDDPNNVWSTNQIPVKSGIPIQVQVQGQPISNLQWKAARAPLSPIPNSALLPDYSSATTLSVFQEIYKAAMVLNNLDLSADEISFFVQNANDFDSVNFNAFTLKTLKRLLDYAVLRDSLPSMPTTLISFFKTNLTSTDPSSLVNNIVSVTNWVADDVTKLIAPNHLNLIDPALYVNEIALTTLQNAMSVKLKIGVDANLLFQWADPLSFFWKTARAIAESIRNTIRSQYDVNTWEQVAQPLFNQLRGNQRDALIAFLLVQQPLRDWGVVDADSLFEFFLIDVQMGSCLQTSRIKQAISTVQLFVERWLLNLEQDENETNLNIDTNRWPSMSGYRLWQADKEVFLWPENWMDPTLRDDSSIPFQALQAKLLQKNMDATAVQDAMKQYLFDVDQTACLQVLGLLEESDENNNMIKMHVFAKTRTSPYYYFYRWFDIVASAWYPWVPLEVDILTYDVEDATNGQTIATGSYIIPVVWNSRLLLFLPQFTKKQLPMAATSDSTTIVDLGNKGVNASTPVYYWEIKMAWTEYRNGKWIPKRISQDTVASVPARPTDPAQNANPPDPGTTPPALPAIDTYQFLPSTVSSGDTATIDIGIFNAGTSALGWYNFDGSHISVVTPASLPFTLSSALSTSFLYFTDSTTKDKTIVSYDEGAAALVSAGLDSYVLPWVTYPAASPNAPVIHLPDGSTQNFYDAVSHQLLARATTSPTIDTIFDYFASMTDDTMNGDIFGSTDDPPAFTQDYNELGTPYALYHWEIGVHVPMLLMTKLLSLQQFDQALAVANYVFDPFATRSTPPKPGDIWKWPPFKNIVPENTLEALFASLGPEEIEPKDSPIESWRDNPFQPFVVARGRRVTYMKWFVMTYINILISYGDFYFMQNTLEALPLAIQLYVRASHIYGPRAQVIPQRGNKQVQTYASLLDKWDGFSNAVVQLELMFPFSNQSTEPLGSIFGENVLANIFGFGTTTYFCIPNNTQLSSLRDLIDDRLYKIRHCQDINGVFRQLPLFEPPLNPGLLVQAAAAGLSFTSVINDLNSPMPNYKFYLLLQKALEICGELKSLGSAFLSIKEKQDAEALSNMRAGHEVTINTLIMNMKTLALADANATLASLQQNRASPVYKLQHYLKLLGKNLPNPPSSANNFTDFIEITEVIEDPSGDGPLFLTSNENTEVSKSADAKSKSDTVGDVEALSSALHALPNPDLQTAPWGIGALVKWGPSSFANAASATARLMKIGADGLTFESVNAGRMNGYTRAIQDRVHQANLAGYEILSIDKSIETQQRKIDLANQDITNQQQLIDNATEVQTFLKDKYTNDQLYAWMETSMRTLHYQTYALAYQLAQKAQKAFCYERGIDPASAKYISFGYWVDSQDGIHSGERLFYSLKTLEAAYHDKRGYDFEITKHISIRQLDPLALFQLRELGTCEIIIPEVLYDMDFPGHYQRMIKSVSLSIPCVTGPYTSISCTLRLLDSVYRTSSLATDKNAYPQDTTTDDARFRNPTSNVPITAIAVSSAQTDSGLFDLSFKDERYIPFEGSGAVSKWRLTLPTPFRQWDYTSINDVILHIKYTSMDGGDALAHVAAGAVADFAQGAVDLSAEQGLFGIFDLRSEFCNEFARATAPGPPAAGTTANIPLVNLPDRLPFYARGVGVTPAKVVATDVYVMVSPVGSWVGAVTLSAGTGSSASTTNLTAGVKEGATAVWQALGAGLTVDGSWVVMLGGGGTGTEKVARAWVVVRVTVN